MKRGALPACCVPRIHILWCDQDSHLCRIELKKNKKFSSSCSARTLTRETSPCLQASKRSLRGSSWDMEIVSTPRLLRPAILLGFSPLCSCDYTPNILVGFVCWKVPLAQRSCWQQTAAIVAQQQQHSHLSHPGQQQQAAEQQPINGKQLWQLHSASQPRLPSPSHNQPSLVQTQFTIHFRVHFWHFHRHSKCSRKIPGLLLMLVTCLLPNLRMWLGKQVVFCSAVSSSVTTTFPLQHNEPVPYCQISAPPPLPVFF